jgi:hypothetical protein
MAAGAWSGDGFVTNEIDERNDTLRWPRNSGLVVVSLIGPSTTMLFDIFLFGIAANILYLFGPITEMYLNWFVDFGERSFLPSFLHKRRRSSK